MPVSGEKALSCKALLQKRPGPWWSLPIVATLYHAHHTAEKETHKLLCLLQKTEPYFVWFFCKRDLVLDGAYQLLPHHTSHKIHRKRRSLIFYVMFRKRALFCMALLEKRVKVLLSLFWKKVLFLWDSLAQEIWYFEGAHWSLPPCTMHFTLKKRKSLNWEVIFRQRALFCRALFAKEIWYSEESHSLFALCTRCLICWQRKSLDWEALFGIRVWEDLFGIRPKP